MIIHEVTNVDGRVGAIYLIQGETSCGTTIRWDYLRAVTGDESYRSLVHDTSTLIAIFAVGPYTRPREALWKRMEHQNDQEVQR